MKGLRILLNEEIERRGFMTINEVHDFAKDLNHKESNAERRLRPSESPNIETIRDKKGNNIGYKYIPLEEIPLFKGTTEQLDTLFDCKDKIVVSEKDLLKYR